ncbi:Uncharacterised protein [Stenotrophomonas maltophilia]|nr:Uncharacterised protein [Stenotrophomonas maltophilia]
MARHFCSRSMRLTTKAMPRNTLTYASRLHGRAMPSRAMRSTTALPVASGRLTQVMPMSTRPTHQLAWGSSTQGKIEQEIDHCQGLIGRTELGDENWLSLAAAQGSVEARLIFAKDPKAIIGDLTEALKDPERITNYRRDAIDYLNESVSLGSVDSIEALADIHDRGIITDKSPEKSLAYWLAYQRAQPNSHSAASIARLSKLLHPNQIERSNEMSEAIYRSCCL